jgi:hypothetical protein
MIGARAMRSLSGWEYLQAMIDGRLPPAPIGGLMAMTAQVTARVLAALGVGVCRHAGGVLQGR